VIVLLIDVVLIINNFLFYCLFAYFFDFICFTEAGKVAQSKLEEMKFKDRKKFRKQKNNVNFELAGKLKSLWEELRKYVLCLLNISLNAVLMPSMGLLIFCIS
jgi:hypothetical protein